MSYSADVRGWLTIHGLEVKVAKSNHEEVTLARGFPAKLTVIVDGEKTERQILVTGVRYECEP